MKNIYHDHKSILTDLNIEFWRIHYDCCFNKGTMYKDLPRDLWPEIKGDIKPIYSGCREINIENTGFKSGSIRSVMYDPPFLVKNTDKPIRICQRYWYFKTNEEFFNHLDKAILEISRILIGKGTLICKIQDSINWTRKIFPAIRIANIASNSWLELRHIAIKVNNNLPAGPNYTYWMIFKKTCRQIRSPKF